MRSWLPRAAQPKRGRKPCAAVDIPSKRRAHMPRQHQRFLCRAMLQHHAAACTRLFGVGVLREIPIRMVDLQEVMKHISGKCRMFSTALELEHHVAGRVTGRRHDFDVTVQATCAVDKVGAPTRSPAARTRETCRTRPAPSSGRCRAFGNNQHRAWKIRSERWGT